MSAVRSSWRVALAWVCSWTCSELFADTHCIQPMATLYSAQGEVDLQVGGSQVWQPIAQGASLCAGDIVAVRRLSRAVLRLEQEQTNIQLGENTTLVLPGVRAEGYSLIELLKGIGHFISRVPRMLQIKTPFVNAAVEGTEFVVEVNSEEAQISVQEGTVRARAPSGDVVMQAGNYVRARVGQALTESAIEQADQRVDWALYYPQVIEFEPEAFTRAGQQPWRHPAAESARALSNSDIKTAFAKLEEALTRRNDADGETDADFQLYRAQLLLLVGQIEEARRSIDKARAVKSGESGAWVLDSLIAVTQNRFTQAMENADKAAASDPRSSAAQLARSYAFQARFELDAAIHAAGLAVDLKPDSELAWARLAEVQLMHGMLDASSAAARRAVELNPQSAHAQTVLGFASLTQAHTAEAIGNFERAALLNQASPWPRLGLGLARIRQGSVVAGRTQLELATSLDPRNALLRSYVGKAYLEEQRFGLAEQQFTQAKQMDPNDPTPWFYSAFAQEQQNRPVAALKDIQESIARNNNRAVYRSRLLLDDDLAVRGVGAARIYQRLGFQQRALVEGARALAISPDNAAAHRLLADAYINRPQHEIARVSENLQNQLLQPLIVEPASPRLGESNLIAFEAVTTPTPGLNEYSQMFERRRSQLRMDGITGSDNTDGYELMASASSARGILSYGRFDFESDGVRVNNDSDQTVQTLFGQYRVTAALSILAEYRDKNAEFGDMRLRFDAAQFSPDERRVLDEKGWLLGLRYAPTPHNTYLMAVSSASLQDKTTLPTLALTGDDDAGLFEAQVLRNYKRSRWIAGLGNALVDGRLVEQLDFSSFGLPSPDPTITSEDIEQSNAYVYGHLLIADSVLTFGASYDAVDVERGIDSGQWNPKLGLTWEMVPKTTLRLAAIKTLRREFVRQQTLEPTQVAGFNQFYDDSLGTSAERHGLAVDTRISANLMMGVELSERGTDLVLLEAGAPRVENRTEKVGRAYLNWIADDHIVVSSEYSHENFDRNFVQGQANSNRPAALKTQRLPLTFRYWLPGGFYTELKTTHVVQDVTNVLNPSGTKVHTDEFLITDVALGYMRPRYLRFVELRFLNVFDETFHYQATDFGTGQAVSTPYYPEPAVFATARFVF